MLGKASTWRRWTAAATAVVVLGVFAPVLKNGFVSWDDVENFVNNRAYQGLGPTQLRWMFTDSIQKGNYEPLNWLVMGLTHSIWGLSPLGYHLTGLLLHAAVTLAFCSLMLRLYSLSQPAARQDDHALPLCAGLAALLFALHPLRVETVAWVSGQHYVLAALFFILSIIAYLRAQGQAAKPRRRWLGGSVAAFVLSLLSFPIGMTLPAVLLLLDVYPLRRVDAKRCFYEKIPFFAAGLAGFGVIFAARMTGGYMESTANYDWGHRLAQALFGAGFYLLKSLLPTALSPFYPLRQLSVLDPTVLLSAAAMLTISAVFVAIRRRYPGGLAGWVFYLVTLSPVLGLTQSGRQMAADRYSYIPGLALSALAGGCLLAAWRAKRSLRAASIAFAVVVLSELSAASRIQARVWRDSESLWRQAVRVSPDHADAHYNLAVALGTKQRWKEADQSYREALRLRPDFPDAHNNLGLLLDEAGDAPQAARHFHKALKGDPRHFEAYNNMGMLLGRQGKLDHAVAYFRKALDINPSYLPSHYNLSTALGRQGRLDEAAHHLRRILEIDPEHRQARERLTRISTRAGGQVKNF